MARRDSLQWNGAPRPAARGRRWLWVPVLVVGAALLVAVQQAVVVTGNPNLVPSLLLLGALLVPVSFVFYLDGRRPDYDLPLSALLICGLLGGVIGTAAASVVESDMAHHLGGLPTLMIGLIEEGAKLLVPIGSFCSPGTGPIPPTGCWSAWRSAPGSRCWKPWATAS
jgi:hypothetical protein